MNRTVMAVVIAGSMTALFFLFMVLRREPAPSVVRVTPPPAPRVNAPPPRSAPEPASPPSAARTRPPRRVEPTPPPPAEPGPSPAPVDTGVMLTVSSDVAGASVFLDREYVGTTPVTVRGLTPGAKHLNVTAEGQDGYAERVTLNEGANTVNVEFKKVRLDASIPVIHRHGVGACEGTLEATVSGLAYRTPNKGDAFSLQFADLEQFDVDYLKKNLRVKQRGGKTWNFTDRRETADGLFVFHRDVQKARERLAAR
jgi:hypothetical protein